MLQQRISIKDNNAEAALFRRRAMVAMAGVILLTLMLLLNLYVVQVIHHDDYQTRSNDNRIKVVPVAPPRGLIFDRNGVLLAENRPVFSLEIIPEQVDDLSKMLDELMAMPSSLARRNSGAVASFGISVLIWQHIIGLHLHWMVLAMSVIILLAVGADYNLLLVSRFKEEIHAGLNTGIIRSMGGTGSVVTSAGLVFAFTMMSMAVSELHVVGQVGTTIGLGLLFDTLIIRSLMTPAELQSS